MTIKQVKYLRSSSLGQGQGPKAYSIEIAEDRQTTVNTVSVQGGLHTLQTLSQLFFAHSKSSTEIYCPLLPHTS